MNSILNKSIFFIFLCFIFLSCKKNANSINFNTATDTNIYVAGTDGSNAVLWKDGTENILSSSGFASDVVVSGNDVYVAGVADESMNLSPGGPSGQFVYWKNGAQNNIGNLRILGPTGPGSVSVANNNVYYANSSCWKNGAIITLPGQGSGFVNCTLVTGNDVYFAGSDSVGDAAYWKNGILNVAGKTSYPGTNAGVFCMYVSGNDVYLGGVNNGSTGTYWKNGVATVLQSPGNGYYVTNVHSIYVSGNDVYALGNLIVPINGGTNAPAYWKNGVENDLPLNGAAYGNTSSIFVNGTDIYVAGYTSAGAVYWKNGVETILSSDGFANSIYVR